MSGSIEIPLRDTDEVTEQKLIFNNLNGTILYFR